MFPNFTELLQVLLIRNRTTYEQILPVNLGILDFQQNIAACMSTNLKRLHLKLYCQKRNF